MSGKQAEELDLVRKFARILAHDANNLTGTILVLSELLAMSDLATPERTADIAAKIRKACWHLQVKINQPVAVDHLVAGARGHVHSSSVADVLRDLASSLAPKKIRIRVLAPELEVTSAGTPLLYAIVIFNLLRNAIEAIGDKEGSITAGISTCKGAEAATDGAIAHRGAIDANTRYFRLHVEDSGKGPENDIADAIFVPFASSDRSGRKLGLGLHYVEAIALGLGGAVVMRRETGTIVEVFIPLAGMTANIDDGAKEKAEQGVDALSHVALVTGDTAWAADFAKIAAPFGARISRLTEPEQIPASVIGEYSSVVFAGDRFDGASLEALHAGRTPFLVVAEPQIDAVRKNLENIRPLNLVRPSTNSAAEALHRLISYGAMR
jgi:two-component sensor histidine kinase